MLSKYFVVVVVVADNSLAVAVGVANLNSRTERMLLMFHRHWTADETFDVGFDCCDNDYSFPQPMSSSIPTPTTS
jgi:hypothetical protein